MFLTVITRVIVLLATGLLSFEAVAQSPESSSASKVDVAPTENPWRKLGNMSNKLGRYVLATDGKYIYQLGGVGFNIRRGGRYGRTFSVFDPANDRWKKLASSPIGTGSAHLGYWPTEKSLVMIGGIKTLGDRFPSGSLTIGLYSLLKKKWEKHSVASPGLGRVAAMTHLSDGRFLLIAGDDGLNSHRSAILELGTGQASDDVTLNVRIISEFPKGGRITGVAHRGDAVLVMQSDSGTSRLQKFNSATGEHLGSVNLSTSFNWMDKLLAWRGNVLVWKNSDPALSSSDEHASDIVLINTESGSCRPIHPEFPGPKSRRSSDGIVVGDSYYLFGGQRGDKLWLKDVHRYQFDNGQADSTE